MNLDWSDSEGIGIALFEQYPSLDPLTLRFTQLRDMVFSLKSFNGDKMACNEKKLEAIQMAWWEEFKSHQ